MEQNEKLDLILDKLQVIECNLDSKQRLNELAKKHWGFTDLDIKCIESARRALEQGGKKENEGRTLMFAMDIFHLIKTVGEEYIMKKFEIDVNTKKRGAE